jgi:hypothetical protein
MSVDAKIMTVVSAIKQSLQMAGGPGSSVNNHPNPFFLNVTGEINLKHAAELIITRLEDYEEALNSKFIAEEKAKMLVALEKAKEEASKAKEEASKAAGAL